MIVRDEALDTSRWSMQTHILKIKYDHLTLKQNGLIHFVAYYRLMALDPNDFHPPGGTRLLFLCDSTDVTGHTPSKKEARMPTCLECVARSASW